MFEFVRAIRIDRDDGVASGRAHVPADHPLFSDHFPGAPYLPGSLAIELAAQIAGPLAEAGTDGRFAFLGMVRGAKFTAPVELPAAIAIDARLVSEREGAAVVRVRLEVAEAVVATVEVVMMLITLADAHDGAVSERNARLTAWKQAW